MKVILKGFFGEVTVPVGVMTKYKKALESGELWRFNKELIEAIENLQKVENESKLIGNTVVCQNIENGKQYIFKAEALGYLNDIFALNIVEVDTSRPWTIEAEKAGEKIVYLDSYSLVDGEMNFYIR